MSTNKSTYIGACLRIKNWKYPEDLDETLYPFNGQMMSPEDGLYYLISNKRDCSDYGLTDIDYDDEKSLEVNSTQLETWLSNFKRDYEKEISYYKERYEDVEVVTYFISDYS